MQLVGLGIGQERPRMRSAAAQHVPSISHGDVGQAAGVVGVVVHAVGPLILQRQQDVELLHLTATDTTHSAAFSDLAH